MKVNHLAILADVIEKIADITDTTTDEVLEALEGRILSEEECGDVCQYIFS